MCERPKQVYCPRYTASRSTLPRWIRDRSLVTGLGGGGGGYKTGGGEGQVRFYPYKKCEWKKVLALLKGGGGGGRNTFCACFDIEA